MNEKRKIWWTDDLRKEWQQNGMMSQKSTLYDSSGLMPQTDAFREFAAREIVKSEVNAYEAGLKARIELEKEVEREKIKTEGAVERAMRVADINSRKSLQRSEVIVDKDGAITIFKEQFAKPLKGRIGFRIGRHCARFTCCDVGEGILYIPFFLGNGETREVYLALSQISDKVIRKKFDCAGIEFGFGKIKEAEYRMKLTRTVLVFAPEIKLPYCHGWNDNDGKLDFISAEKLTWRDMVKFTY